MKNILFSELEQWTHRSDFYSINDFLKEKGLSIDEFESIANTSEKFMKIWGKAESLTWENLKNALFTKSLPRSRIADYIKKSNIFHDQDPEEVMRSLEESEARFQLYQKAIDGDIDSLLMASLERGMINESTYKDILAIKEELDEEDVETY